MPKFTLELTYELPVYVHRTIEADSLEAAIAHALEHEDWEKAKEDYDTSGPTYVSGAWAGEVEPYHADAPVLPIPAEYGYAANNRAGEALSGADPWEDDPEFTAADWAAEVAANDTRRGYLDWVRAKREEASGTPCPDCGGAGAFPELGSDCGRCLGGGTITPETEAYLTIEDRYISAAIAAGWREQPDGSWAHDGEGDGEPGLVGSARAACDLDNIAVE